ncbi:MAG: rRNA maturation RNase YbeY [Gemmatimonadetes bacterium]|nr:rRNA maturation RNase YbeY [Gemmatimonadota bacterium]
MRRRCHGSLEAGGAKGAWLPDVGEARGRRGRWILIRVQVQVHSGAAVSETALDRAVRTVLSAEGVSEAEVSLTLLDDPAIAELHGRYLGTQAPTDVLSFALHEDGEPPLGDIYIGHETASRRAAELGVAAGEELLRLAVHGLLHILGYDHPDVGRYESPMFKRQEDLVSRILAEEEAM